MTPEFLLFVGCSRRSQLQIQDIWRRYEQANNLQVSRRKSLDTEEIEIQGEKPRKSEPGQNLLIFLAERLRI